MAKILVIDDEAPIRTGLKDILEYEGYKVIEAVDGQEGVSLARKFAFDAILCDVRMPQLDGLGLLEALQGHHTPIIMITGHGTVDTAVAALKQGAFDFIQKPLDLNRVLIAVRHAVERQELLRQKEDLERKIHENQATTIVGDSPAIRELIDMVATVAPTDARVLITGSNGVGKELVARQLHELSSRAQGPFVEVNCAAIPSELIESELFGHEKGSFTGAVKQRRGKFELAHGGTLFLDEIGDMDASAQAKVLRALQENRVTRVGGDDEIEVDVRVVAATNKLLRDEILAGRFREDLYHRLAVIPLHVPDLRDRSEDIPLLVSFFLERVCSGHGRPIPVVAPEAMSLLQSAPWTGNIRELRNVVERLVILTPRDQFITAESVQKFAALV
jgi:two-component system nitrogen regulation response regulator NtrX